MDHGGLMASVEILSGQPPVAKVVADCKFLKEEDERLGCFNRFFVQPAPPKAARKAAPKAQPSK
jgi:hypothetical protein